MSSRLARRAPLGVLTPLGVLAVALFGAQAPPDRNESGEGVEHPENPGHAPYRVLDNVEGPWVNLNAVPVRPLAHDPASGDTWALDTHGSTVVRIDPAGPVVHTIRTPWSPAAAELRDYVPQAQRRNCDLAVLGTTAAARP